MITDWNYKSTVYIWLLYYNWKHPLNSTKARNILIHHPISSSCEEEKKHALLSAGVQPQLIQGIRRRDCIGEGQETTA